MCPSVDATFQVNRKVDEAFSLIYKTLAELVGGNLKIVREAPAPSKGSPRRPSYVSMEYKSGIIGKRAIELRLEDRQTQTVASLKWFYPVYKAKDGVANALIWDKKTKSVHQDTIVLVEELKSRVGATAVAPDQQVVTKEVVKESQVIVKIRCRYCNNVFDETLDKCPHCGGKR